MPYALVRSEEYAGWPPLRRAAMQSAQEQVLGHSHNVGGDSQPVLAFSVSLLGGMSDEIKTALGFKDSSTTTSMFVSLCVFKR